MWLSFLIGLAVGGGLVMLAAHRRASRLARQAEADRAQSAVQLEALADERDRLHAACASMEPLPPKRVRYPGPAASPPPPNALPMIG